MFNFVRSLRAKESMETLKLQWYQNLKRYWRNRSYQRLRGGGSSSSKKKATRTVRLGGNSPTPKLQVNVSLSPLKNVMAGARDAYVDGMLGVAGRSQSVRSEEVFGGRRVPRARSVGTEKGKEFERKLLFEICKSIAASRNLAAAASRNLAAAI